MLARLIIAAIFLQISSQAFSQNQNKYLGLEFGIGLSATQDNGGRRRVESAQIVNGVVRATEIRDYPVRMLLESHYFFESGFSIEKDKNYTIGYGPMVAIQPGSDGIIDAFAIGIIFGLKRPSSNQNGSSWNIGFGLILDPKVKTLGDGFKLNEAPPAGETEVRYTTRAQGGPFIMTSFSW